ncbi:MAG TPA: hypothetical protein VGW12_04860 [Pyrinomonadaceae bacterium]|nr:hypothetical protein [Pyrinomonadaceae bacterium]
MKIFASWSGNLSHITALFLKEWLRSVIQAVELYVSSEDINKGTRWFAEIGSELESANFGIVCLTRENVNAPWILFESGALSKSLTQSRVTPLLIDLSPADLKGPLVQFQATTITKVDMYKLVKTINNYCESPIAESQLEKSFNKWWPDLENFFNEALNATKEEPRKEEKRDQQELLEEILQLARTIARSIPKSPPRSQTHSLRISSRTLVEQIKSSLEDRRKPFLAIALEGARKVSIEGDELYVEYAPEAKHLRDNLTKPESIKLLREVCSEVVGRAMGVRISVRDFNDSDIDSDESESQQVDEERRRLREFAENDPSVQQVLRAFGAEIVDVQRADEKKSNG